MVERQTTTDAGAWYTIKAPCGSGELIIIIVELLGETRIIRIIILIIIIPAGTPLVSHSVNFNWKPKCIDPKLQYILDSS